MIATSPTIEMVYNPRGAAAELFLRRDPELVLSGPAGTGKSLSILQKLHLIALKYPMCRLLMVRKTRRSLTESGMVTYWQKIRPDLDRVQWKPSMQQYQYPNGSILAVGGLDKPSKIMSSEWDIIYVQEATELTENDWEACTIRLRNGKVPYQQIIGDCNPDAPTHWLKQRAISGKVLMLESRHEDNPLLFNEHSIMTEEGQRYLSMLESLSGVRLSRYRYGIWSAAEGTVYEDSWDRARNVIDRREIPIEFPRFLVVDFGFTHPFVCLWAAQDPDGRLIIYRQIYMTKRLVEDHAKEIKRVSRWGQPNGDPFPRAIICDHDAEDKATLEKHLGLRTIRAQKNVSAGIQLVASRFRLAGDGKPRLMVMRDGLVERDRELMERKQPTCLEDEPDVYVWDTRQGAKKGDMPVKENDHACLAAGTLVTTNQGDIPIEQIKAGDYVLTRNGYRRVKMAGLTAESAEVFTVKFSDGRTLTGTANHPIYLSTQGYIALHAMRYGDIIEDIKSYSQQYTGRCPLLCQSVPQREWKSLLTKGSCLDAILSLLHGPMQTTTDRTPFISRQVLKPCMRKFGKTLTVLSQKVAIFTTGTAIQATMRLKTSNALPQRLMRNIMLHVLPQNKQHGSEHMSRRYGHWLRHGIDQRRGVRGIEPLLLWLGRTRNIETILASNAVRCTNHAICKRIMPAFAPTLVSQRGGETLGLITRRVPANTVGKSLSVASMSSNHSVPLHAKQWQDSLIRLKKQGYVQCVSPHLLQDEATNKNTALAPAQVVAVCSISKNKALQPVYNLTIENPEGEGEYFANGVLVHNCDALRYLVAYHDLVPSEVRYSSRVY